MFFFLRRKVIIIVEICLLIVGGFYFYSEFVRPYLLFYQEIHSKKWQNALNNFKKLPNNENEICFVGNSLTLMFDLQWFNNNKIVNRGIGGDFTKGVLLRLNEITESHPAKIFLEIGINDILARMPSDEILLNYKEIINSIREKSPSTKIYIQSILPVILTNSFYVSNEKANEEVLEVNEKLQQMCLENSINYIDLYSSFVLEGSLNPKFSLDGVHLTKQGYSTWRNLIENLVNQ